KLLEPFLAPRRIEKRLEEFWVELGKGEQSNGALHCRIEILNKVVMEQQLSIDKMWGVLARMSDRIWERK
ncbi:MAG: SlyX family protein, partial [Cystobacterineae bacterium]|nr:SlyX family protein [Cystobacterineae bacterium]